MTRLTQLACCVAALFALVAASPLLQTVNGTWVYSPSTYEYGRQLKLSSDGDEHTMHWQETLPLDAAPKSANFSIRRDAGTFNLTGTLSKDGGSGQFTFAPSAAFVNGLVSRNLQPASVHDIMAAASVDLTLPYIDSISAAGYPNLGFDKMLAFRAVGATPSSIADLRSLFGTLSEDDVVSTSALHVTRAYVQELRDMGLDPVTAERAVTFKALHIDKAYLQHLRAHGLKNLTAQQVIEMKAAGL